MFRIFFAVCFMVVAYTAPAWAQSRGNANLNWSGAWTSPSASDQSLLNGQALLDYQLGHGILNPGASNDYDINNNGPVSQTFNGPFSSSGSTVTNIGNLNSSTVTTQATNSTVTTGLSTGQTANGATQSGSANSNAATGNGGFNAANNITTLAQ